MKRQSGLTLLEVMVALMVLALVLGGTVRAVGSFANNYEHLARRTLAQWVASNVLTEAQLGLWPAGSGEDSGEETMGGTTWRWVMVREPTDRAIVQRVTVEVALADTPDQVEYRVSGLRILEPASG